MAGYYNVKVLEINEEEASVKLYVHMFNPDGGRIYDSVGFGLSLLDNREMKSSLIATELDMDDLYDPKWATKYANGFVKRVVKEDLKPVVYTEWEGAEATPAAYMTIYCTDKAWLSHLRVGEEWESYAYEISRYYERCEPIVYGKSESVSTEIIEAKDYWMPVPSFLFDQGTYKLPNTVYIPKYTASSYMVGKVIEFSENDSTELKDFHGKYVRELDKDQSGILVWNGGENYATIFSINDGSRGARQYYKSSPIMKIGLLVPKPNFNRNNERVSYARLFEAADLFIKSAKRNRKMITLEVAGITDVEDLRLNKAQVLKMICNNFVSTYQYTSQIEDEYPLSKLLQFFDSKEGVKRRNMLNKVADGIILNYDIELPGESLADFDSLDRESLIDYFDHEKWPCHIFHIEISDEAFGLQIDQVTKINKRIRFTGIDHEIVKWDEPILWKDYKAMVLGN